MTKCFEGYVGSSVIRVVINGFGIIGKRVVDVVDVQDDMEVVGVIKIGLSFGCSLVVKKGYLLYCISDDFDCIVLFLLGGYDC